MTVDDDEHAEHDESDEANDLAYRFIDDLCSDRPLSANRSPMVMLRALGIIVTNIAQTFEIGLDHALAIVEKEACDLDRFCREEQGEDLH
jgi:hypothetical protein